MNARVVLWGKRGLFFRTLAWIPCLALAGFFLACNLSQVNRKLYPPENYQKLPQQMGYLKAHMQSGNVYVFSEWRILKGKPQIQGQGVLMNQNRQTVKKGQFTLAVDSVAIFESNQVQTSSQVASMTIMTVASLGLSVYCITNPKACFGSCPTFYVSDGEKPILQAEGFSASISRSLEAQDIDALYRARAQNNRLEVLMKNEALETHVVRSVKLLVVPRAANERAFATQEGEFWASRHIEPPVRATANGENIRPRVRRFDANEWYSLADSAYLGRKESIELEFSPQEKGKYGLVISGRQSLLTTYLFYQTLAYMGKKAADYFAQLERMDPELRRRIKAPGQLLGGIEGFIWSPKDGTWQKFGEARETGPLAIETRILPFEHSGDGPVKIRLRLTRGNWRIDYLALARLQRQVQPLVLEPVQVFKQNLADAEAKNLLLDPSRQLVTFPGDQYRLIFDLPEKKGEREFFLLSQGYYYEWMRQPWLDEENPMMATLMFFNPEAALRRLAPAYKKVEDQMETIFWRNRYAH